MTLNKINQKFALAEFLGWHVGDGCISINKNRSQYTLTGDIKEECSFYQNIVVPDFNNIFYKNLKEKIILRKYEKVGVCGIYLFKKEFVNLLIKKFNFPIGKKINIKVPSFVKTAEQKKHFLRGLFDTDGSIYFCKSNFKTKNKSLYNKLHYKPKIKLSTISKALIEEVNNMLHELDFSSRIQKPIQQRRNENIIYSVILDKNEDTKKWIEEIGFRNIKHFSKVDVWKKFGFCPPHTSLDQRLKILRGEINPLIFYPNECMESLNVIKATLNNC